MKRTTLAALGVLVGATSIVSARQYIEFREYAAPSVIDVSTLQYGRTAYRAITGYERRRPYLVIEEVGWARRDRRDWRDRRDRTRPEPMATEEMRDGAELSERYDDFEGRRGALTVRTQRPVGFVLLRNQNVALDSFRGITLEGWSNGRLIFSVGDSRSSYRCSVGVADQQPATCDGGWAPQPAPQPQPQPYPGPTPQPGPSPDLEVLKAATAACGNAFMSTSVRESCIQLLINAPFDLRPSLTACGRAFMGTNDQLECLRQASAYRGDTPAVLAQCSRAFMGSSTIMTCFDVVARNALVPGVVPACANAVMGSSDQLRCMNAVAGARRDPVALINYCRENQMGSSAIISCIEKYR